MAKRGVYGFGRGRREYTSGADWETVRAELGKKERIGWERGGQRANGPM